MLYVNCIFEQRSTTIGIPLHRSIYSRPHTLRPAFPNASAWAPALGACGITQSNWITNPIGQRKARGSGWMDALALSCECLLMNGQGSEDSVRQSSRVQGLRDFALLCCYFSLECNISKMPGIASGFYSCLAKIQASFLLNPSPIFLLLSVSMLDNFPQSYLPLFTPALLGSSFLHLLLVSLCLLTSLLACFPWLSTAVALSAKPLFSSALFYKLAGCLSQAPALLMPADVSGNCLSPGQRAGSAGCFDSGHLTSAWMRGVFMRSLLIHAAVQAKKLFQTLVFPRFLRTLDYCLVRLSVISNGV